MVQNGLQKQMKLDITPDTRAMVAAQILSGIISSEGRGPSQSMISQAVRATEDLIEGLERSPHGSFPDQQDVR